MSKCLYRDRPALQSLGQIIGELFASAGQLPVDDNRLSTVAHARIQCTQNLKTVSI